MEIRDREAIGARGAIVILTVTVILAMLMHRYVEQPLQQVTKRARPSRLRSTNKITVAAGVALIALAGTTTTALAPKPADVEASYNGIDEASYPGAAQYFNSQPLPKAEPFPALEQIDDYKADYTKRGCNQGPGPGKDEVKVCEDENAPENPTATVVLAGGSHAGHLEGAFKKLGQKYGWEVLVITKSRCDFGIEENLEDSWCDIWGDNLIEWFSANEVDLVVTPGTRMDEPEYVLDRAPLWWDKIAATDTNLMLVRGMPRGDNIPECLAEGGTSQECGFSKDVFAGTNPLTEFNLPENVQQVDVSPYVCPQLENPATENCDGIVGNIVVSYDTNHLTSVFSRSLAPAFEEEMKDAAPYLFK